jgi:phage-related protein
MLNETFYLDGIDARSVGIYLQSPIQFSEAVPILETQSIPGRNGDLIFETGSYENRSGTAFCFCLQENVENAISSAGRFLMNKRGYRRLETSDDPNHYWMARVENSPQITMRLRTLAPFEVGFDCKPQRFLKSGENAVSFSRSGRIENVYGQNARPLITVYGNGNGSLTIGKYTVSIESIGGSICLDSETQNAYNNYENQNANINAPEFPVIEPGDNVVSFQGGITSVEIVPRWWEV